MNNRPARPGTGWSSDTKGAIISFGVEALIVLALALIGILISALALWLV